MDLAGREPRPRTGELAPGEYIATCWSAARETSAAGNACVRWTFSFPGGQRLDYWTVARRIETGLVAQALGIGRKPLRLAEAFGRQARVTVAKDGPYMKVTGVRPL